ncbi:MAG: DinB family protein [Acidobacteriota bacterium]|nr:DinB family protein [Acidobacteriota bacterium]
MAGTFYRGCDEVICLIHRHGAAELSKLAGRADAADRVGVQGHGRQPIRWPLVQLMQHVVNHGTSHRGQVTMMLRQVGAEAVGSDMVYFYRERAGR